MQKEPATLLQDYLDHKITGGDEAVAKIIAKEIREGSFTKALEYLIPIATSFGARNPDDLDFYWSGNGSGRIYCGDDYLGGDPRTKNRLALVMAPLRNSVAPKVFFMAGKVMVDVYENRQGPLGSILQMVRAHFEHAHNLDPYVPPTLDVVDEIKKHNNLPGTGIVLKIFEKTKENRFSAALPFLAPLTRHVLDRETEGHLVFGRQVSGDSMLLVRYLKNCTKLRPYNKLDKPTQTAIYIALEANPQTSLQMSPLEKTLAANMLADACRSADWGAHRYFLLAASDYLAHTDITEEDYLKTPPPVRSLGKPMGPRPEGYKL